MKAWKKNLYIIWFAQIISLVGFGFGLPFIPYYLQELGVTDPEKLKFWTGMLSSAPAITMGIMAPVWGYVADRYGRKLMLLRALGMGGLIIFMMSRIHTPEQLFMLRILQGMFSGTIGASATLVASGTPENRLSASLGFLSSSTFIGLSIGPFIGGMIAEHFGYRISFAYGGAILATGFILVLLLVTEVGKPAVPAGQREAKKRPGLRSFLTKSMLSALLVVLILRLTRSITNPFLPLIVQEFTGRLDGAARTTGTISAINGAVTAISAITISRMGDRVSKKRLLTVLLAAAGMIGLPLYFTNNLYFFAAIFALMFLPLGGVEPILQSLLSQSVKAENRGVLFGLLSSVGCVGWFVAPLLGSWISIQWSTQAIFLLYPFLLLATAAAIRGLIREIRPDITKDSPG